MTAASMLTTNFTQSIQGKAQLSFFSCFYLLDVLFKIYTLSHISKEYI